MSILIYKIKKRAEALIGALRSDHKLAIKLLEWLLLRKTLFQIMKWEPIFSIALKGNKQLGSALFPLTGLSGLTSKENCLEYMFGIYEPWVGRLIEKELGKEQREKRTERERRKVFIDVGANVGYFSTLAAGKGARVYAFEPVDMTYSHLIRVKNKNPDLDLTIENLAVGHKNGKAVMRVWRTNKSPGSYLPREIETRELAGEGEEVEVNMVTLDSYVVQKDVDRIDVLKIDVEGYESFVLEGARACIEKYKPTIICEVADDIYREKTASLLKQISQEFGYKMKFADGRSGEPDLMKTRETTDIVLYR